MYWLIVPGWGIRRQSHAARPDNAASVVRELRSRVGADWRCRRSPIGHEHAHPTSAAVTGVAVAVVVVGAIALSASHIFDRPLDCTNDDRLAASYRTRFFLRVAFSEAVSLLGFVGFILSNNGWLYALGALFTAIGYYRLAPTAAHLAKIRTT